jgi:putative oxidoreductase
MKSISSCHHGAKCAGKCVDLGLLLLRLGAGIIFVLHGWIKLFGESGVDGFAGFLGALGVPAAAFMAWALSLLEFVGGIALIAGIFVTPVAALLAIEMLVAFFLTKKTLPKGDLDIALFAMMLALALAGGGAYVLWKGKRGCSSCKNNTCTCSAKSAAPVCPSCKNSPCSCTK